jgi:hypothetical protein
VKEQMMRRDDTAGIRQEHPALAIPAPHGRCGNRPAIDEHVISDFDTLPRQCRNSLNQWRVPASAKPPPQISAAPCLNEHRGVGWAQKHQITDGDRTLKRFNTP